MGGLVLWRGCGSLTKLSVSLVMSTVLQNLGKLAMHRRTPVQAPKIDFAKTSRSGTTSALVSELRSPKKRSGTMRKDVRTDSY